MSGAGDYVPAHNVRRAKLTNEMAAKLRQQIYDVLAQDNPQSIRHIFYRMVDKRLEVPVTKDDSGYRTVQGQIKIMRRKGQIPYGWISDATRRGYHVRTFKSQADFISRMAGLYRSDAWQRSENYVEVWTESRSIAGTIEDDCDALGVSLYPAGGFTSLTLAYESAQEINAACKEGRACKIVYIGDYDPAGVLIDRKIEAELRQHLDADVDLEFRRIAINEEQINWYDLPTNPRKTTDKRSAHIAATVEAEAMPAHVMRCLLRGVVEGYMPPGALAAARAAEESEREGLWSLAEAMKRHDA